MLKGCLIVSGGSSQNDRNDRKDTSADGHAGVFYFTQYAVCQLDMRFIYP